MLVGIKEKSAVLLLLASVTLGTVACSGQANDQGKARAENLSGIAVKVFPVEKGDVTATLSYFGDVKAKSQVSVMPKVAGRIDDLRVDAGASVKEGDVIAIIEHASLDAQVQQANANLESAKSRYEQVANPNKSTVDTAIANLKKSEAALKLAQKNYDLVSYRGDIEAMPQATALEQATLDYEIALATYNLRVKPSYQDIAIARAAVSLAEAAVTIARNQLKEATIVAPVSGVITERFLSKGATASPSTPIVVIMSNDVEIAVSIEESRLSEIKQGQQAIIKVGAYPDQTFPGRVEQIAPASDPKSRTFLTKVIPDPQDAKLKPGMYAEVSLQTQQHKSSLLVPKDAVVAKGNKSIVYTLEDGRAKGKLVKTGLTDNRSVAILEGLSSEDEIIVNGNNNLNDNDRVIPERMAR